MTDVWPEESFVPAVNLWSDCSFVDNLFAYLVNLNIETHEKNNDANGYDNNAIDSLRHIKQGGCAG